MLYDVTLPGNAPPKHLCPHRDCEAPFDGNFSDGDLATWETALQHGEAAVRDHLRMSGAYEVGHTPTCPFRCLPPAVLALCSDDQVIAHHNRVWAILDDC